MRGCPYRLQDSLRAQRDNVLGKVGIRQGTESMVLGWKFSQGGGSPECLPQAAKVDNAP